jgi:DUF4097 and DUF4098 domain-containing protein YvlB
MGLITLSALVSAGQQTKKASYQVGSKPVISVTNDYGPITLRPSGAREVRVTMISQSDAVGFTSAQHGDRVELQSVSSGRGTNSAELTVLVPNDACVRLQSSSSVLHAEGFRGDLILESASGAVEVNDFEGGHIHVHVLNGPTALVHVHGSNVDVTSVGGDVNLRDITSSSGTVYSGAGKIAYEGDPGNGGHFKLMTRTGDIDVSIPASSPVKIKSRRMFMRSGSETLAAEDEPSKGKESFFLTAQIAQRSVVVLRSV